MVLYLVPATASWAALENRFTDKNLLATKPKAVNPDVPPPLRFDNKSRAGPILPAGAYPASWAPYVAQVRSQLIALLRSGLDAMIKANKTDHRDVNLSVALWVGQDGHVSQVRLDGSSGDLAADAVVRDAIQARLILPRPPNEMPLPIKVKILYHGWPSVLHQVPASNSR